MSYKTFMILSIFLVLLFSHSIFGGTSWSTPNRTFNVTPNITFLNWTNSYSVNLTLGMNTSWGILVVRNESTGSMRHGVVPNYSQPDSSHPDECGVSSDTSFLFYVKNSTGYFTSTTQNITEGNSEVMTILSGMNDTCPPGFYWGHIKIENSSDSSEYYSLPVYMHIPISSHNELNLTTRTGHFKGKMPANASTYHSYFFNTTEIPSATSVVVTLTWSDYNQDMDLFLFDSNGNLKAKSINSGTSERLSYQYLPPDEMWEIRVFGNSSSQIDYTSGGSLYFSTLNATNISDNSQISLIDFGERNISDTVSTIFRLKNEGQTNLTSVVESYEMYHIEKYDRNTASNFTFRVPDFITKIRTEVNWTGFANYTIKLYKPDGTLYGSSTDKHINANVSGAMQEEYVEYNPSGTVGLSDDGMWRVEVVNNSNSLSQYSVIIKEWVNASNWINTNYSTMDINAKGETNDSVVIELNFTVNRMAISGIYEGKLKYTSSSSTIEVPFKVNVSTGELMINNSFNSSMLDIKDNIGFNKTVIFHIPINNTGTQTITFDSQSNSSFLNYSSNYMNFSYTYPTSVTAGGSDTLNISITLDTTKTGNHAGVYSGWLWLNYTNSYPYSGYNLSIQFNLSQYLDVYLRNIQSADGDSWVEFPANGENITLIAEVFLINGTEIEDLSKYNFSNVYLSNKNISYTIPSSGYLTLYNYTTSLYRSLYGQYWINASLSGSSSRPGGYYNIYLTATKKEGNVNLQGSTYNGTIVINNTALYLSTSDDSFYFTEGTEGDEYFNLSVINYGPKTATGRITLNSSDSDCDYVEIDSKDAKSGCYVSKVEDYFVVSISEGEGCWFRWRFETDNVSEDRTCSAQIVLDDPAINSQNVRIHIENLESSSDDDSSSSSDNSGTSSGSEEDISISQYPSSLTIAQGENETFTINVENTGDVDEEDITLNIDGIPSSWYTYSPNSLDIDSSDDADFNVTISVPDDAEVREYNITFNVINDNVSDSKLSNLLVMPSEDTKNEIEQSYEKYMENYTYLEDKLKEMITQGKNVTELNNTINNIKIKLNDLGILINASDYFNAAQMIGEIESLITLASSLVEEEESVEIEENDLASTNSYVWLFVGVIIIIISGFMVYMFMPIPKETYTAKKFKYTPPGVKKPFLKKLKKNLEKIKFRAKLKKKRSPWKKK